MQKSLGITAQCCFNIYMKTDLKDEILTQWLQDIAFDGLTWSSLQNTAERITGTKDTAAALFPHKLNTALTNIAYNCDLHMIEMLEENNKDYESIREMVGDAVMTRLSLMQPNKESYRLISAYLARPTNVVLTNKILWQTADKIWAWAGDTATDYNRYTKRGLLTGILGATYIYWLQDSDENNSKTKDFLSRRIENTVKIGRFIGSVTKKIPNRHSSKCKKQA